MKLCSIMAYLLLGWIAFQLSQLITEQYSTRLGTRTKESGTVARSNDVIVSSEAKASGAHAPPFSVLTGRESYFWDPKDCELYPNWLKPGETLVEDLVTMLTCKSLV